MPLHGESRPMAMPVMSTNEAPILISLGLLFGAGAAVYANRDEILEFVERKLMERRLRIRHSRMPYQPATVSSHAWADPDDDSDIYDRPANHQTDDTYKLDSLTSRQSESHAFPGPATSFFSSGQSSSETSYEHFSEFPEMVEIRHRNRGLNEASLARHPVSLSYPRAADSEYVSPADSLSVPYRRRADSLTSYDELPPGFLDRDAILSGDSPSSATAQISGENDFASDASWSLASEDETPTVSEAFTPTASEIGSLDDYDVLSIASDEQLVQRVRALRRTVIR